MHYIISGLLKLAIGAIYVAYISMLPRQCRAGPAHRMFLDQDVGLINDSEPLLTVLHDARYAGISGYDFNGQTNFELTGTIRDKLE